MRLKRPFEDGESETEHENLENINGEPRHDVDNLKHLTRAALIQTVEKVRAAQHEEGQIDRLDQGDKKRKRDELIEILEERYNHDRIMVPLLARARELEIATTEHMRGFIDVDGFTLRRRINNYGSVTFHTQNQKNDEAIASMLWERRLRVNGTLCEKIFRLLKYEFERNKKICKWPYEIQATQLWGDAAHDQDEEAEEQNTQDNSVFHVFEWNMRLDFRQHDVMGDGNCLFRAFARSYWGTERLHRRVRFDAQRIFNWGTRGYFGTLGHDDVDFRTQNHVSISRLGVYFALEDQSRQVSPTAGIWHQLYRDGTWGSDEMLQLLADAYDAEIFVFTLRRNPELQTSWWAFSMVRGRWGAQHQIYLGHLSARNHWISLERLRPRAGRLQAHLNGLNPSDRNPVFGHQWRLGYPALLRRVYHPHRDISRILEGSTWSPQAVNPRRDANYAVTITKRHWEDDAFLETVANSEIWERNHFAELEHTFVDFRGNELKTFGRRNHTVDDENRRLEGAEKQDFDEIERRSRRRAPVRQPSEHDDADDEGDGGAEGHGEEEGDGEGEGEGENEEEGDAQNENSGDAEGQEETEQNEEQQGEEKEQQSGDPGEPRDTTESVEPQADQEGGNNEPAADNDSGSTTEELDDTVYENHTQRQRQRQRQRLQNIAAAAWDETLKDLSNRP
jgi:hypothetical protein